VHSRWSIEAYGRHAVAVTTPVFVEPAKEIIFTADQLRRVSQACETLRGELNGLREKHPL